MKLHYIHPRFVCESTFQEKDIPKAAGFRWDADKKSWWTDDPIRALKLKEYASNGAAEKLVEFEKVKAEKIEASKATDADVEIPIPEGLEYLGYQKAGIAFALRNKNILIGDEMGLGKMLPNSEPVLTPIGWRLMGDLRIGDDVIGRDGRSTRVEGVYPQGVQPIVKVTFSDGFWTRCSWDHLWSVQHVRNGHRDGYQWHTRTTRQIVDAGLADGVGNRTWRIPMVAPVEYEPVNLPLDPYVLGVLLGNGSFGSSVTITGDREIADALGIQGRHRAHRTSGPEITEFLVTDDDVKSAVVRLGLSGKRAWDKHVPGPYLRGSADERLALLQGLMDSDGYPMPQGGAEFCSTSPALADAVIAITQSLGGIARGRRQAKATFTYKGETRQGRPAERVNLNLPAPFVPFRGRKAASYVVPTKYQPTRLIATVVDDGEEEATCIKVAAADGLFVTRSFVVTHNTIQALGVINADPEIKKVLVICPASLKLNWKREAEKWLVRKFDIQIADSKNFPNANFVIINYDVIRQNKEALDGIEFDLLILDEVHKLKNGKAQRTQLVLGKKEKKDSEWIWKHKPIAAKRIIALTGTPIVNRPVELWTIIHALDVKTWSNWSYFTKRYCDAHQGRYGWEVDGASNLDELQEKLRMSLMVRRLKSEVLTELPPKRRQVIELPANGCISVIDAESRAWKAHECAIEQLKIAVELAKASDDPNVYTAAVEALQKGVRIAFTEISQLRHDTAVAKIPYVIEHIEAAIEESKVVCFAHHKDVVAALKEHFSDTAVILTGDCKMEDRQTSVDRFQSDPAVKLFIGSITAAGVGITLTASSHVVFAELDWVPGNLTQAEDRTHRIGQKESVLVQHLVLEGSLDATMAKTIVKKQDVIDRALDREVKQVELSLPTIPNESTKSESKSRIDKVAEELDESEIPAIHAALKAIAARCNYASTWDSYGFNKIDTQVGHSLAESTQLTKRQAALGKMICRKYKRQLAEFGIEL